MQNRLVAVKVFNIMNHEDSLANDQRIQEKYSQYHGDLRRYIGKLLSSPEDIEDVLQETFLRITQSPPSIEQHDKARAYIFVIAANIVKDKLRRTITRHDKDHIPTDDLALCSDTPNPESSAVSEQLKNDLLNELKNLNSKYSQIFVMHRFLHLTHEEIAKKLNISVRTVERRMSYALDHFRLQLREYL